MGICGFKNNSNFIHSIIIDSKLNIVVGIYNSNTNTNLNSNSNSNSNSNTNTNANMDSNEIFQGIQIDFTGKIYNLLFASLHKNFNMVILNFENNIMLKIYLDSDDLKIKYKLVRGNNSFSNPMNSITINKIKHTNFDNFNDFDINIIVILIQYIKRKNYNH